MIAGVDIKFFESRKVTTNVNIPTSVFYCKSPRPPKSGREAADISYALRPYFSGQIDRSTQCLIKNIIKNEFTHSEQRPPVSAILVYS